MTKEVKAWDIRLSVSQAGSIAARFSIWWDDHHEVYRDTTHGYAAFIQSMTDTEWAQVMQVPSIKIYHE